MRSLLLALLVPLAVSPSIGAQSRPTDSEISRSVDSLAGRVISAGVSPALGVAVVRDGQTIFLKAYGWADVTRKIRANERTLWYLASTSKSYTGFGISLLVHQGALSLDTPITTLLPGVEWPAGVNPSRLTLVQFLSHTHHINDNAVVQSAAYTGAIPERDWPSLIRYAAPSGNGDLVYSNFGYNVAAMVIDRLRPEGWRAFLDSAVYRPAGMRETYTRVSGLDPRRIAKPHGLGPDGGFITRKFEKADATMNSAGGHLATLHDLARWMIVQMDSGRIDGKQVFPAAAVVAGQRLLARHTVEASRRFAFFDRDGWGTGWDLGSYRGEPMVSRFGGYSSIRSHLGMLPARRIGVTAQVNGPGASQVTDIIAALVYDLDAARPDARAIASARLDSLIAQQPAARQRAAAADSTRQARQHPLVRPVTDYTGSYADPAFGEFTVLQEGDGLRFRWGVLEGPIDGVDVEHNQFRIEIAGNGQVMGFRFEGAGPARSLSLVGTSFARK